ncbi:hypothetical protein MNBD_NITROSPINAE01-1001 [hydrothermal vent metagenome]|uniref:Uncharacterized protein n=1 Tax=hydrothermal vent metagenome TaxID=652676 RepID=A0A3B1C0K9_9ZZZZ
MSVKTEDKAICRHCGGALIERFDEVNCVMCGRASNHICDNCQFHGQEEESVKSA